MGGAQNRAQGSAGHTGAHALIENYEALITVKTEGDIYVVTV